MNKKKMDTDRKKNISKKKGLELQKKIHLLLYKRSESF